MLVRIRCKFALQNCIELILHGRIKPSLLSSVKCTAPSSLERLCLQTNYFFIISLLRNIPDTGPTVQAREMGTCHTSRFVHK